MTPMCQREDEVLDAMLADGTLASASDELHRHVEQCAVCADVRAVAGMLRRDDLALERSASVPSAGQVWWRAAVRARMEAAQAAARPVTWAQGLTAAAVFGIVSAVAVLTWPFLQRLAGTVFSRMVEGVDVTMLELLSPVMAVIQRSVPLALAVALTVILAPLLVLYFALAGEE